MNFLSQSVPLVLVLPFSFFFFFVEFLYALRVFIFYFHLFWTKRRRIFLSWLFCCQTLAFWSHLTLILHVFSRLAFSLTHSRCCSIYLLLVQCCWTVSLCRTGVHCATRRTRNYYPGSCRLHCRCHQPFQVDWLAFSRWCSSASSLVPSTHFLPTFMLHCDYCTVRTREP